MSNKPAKSRLITLKLPPALLTKWPSTTTPPALSTAPSLKNEPSPSVQPPEADKSSDSHSTPVPAAADGSLDPNSLAPPPKADNKKKRAAPNPTGRKRAPPSIDPNAPPRERGRPGPKKKPRLPDGTIDRSGENPNASTRPANSIPAHKLGPKANTGAINAGLRALDRTGKPCRRWGKKSLQIKSFTGTMWSMGTWNAPPRDQGFAGDVKSDSASSSDPKQNHESSALQSERSQSHIGDDTVMSGVQTSSAPQVAAA